MVRRNRILKHLTEGEIKGSIKVSGSWGRRRDQILDDLKEKLSYREMKKKAQDQTLWKTCLGRGYGPGVRQTWKSMNVYFVLKINTSVDILLFLSLIRITAQTNRPNKPCCTPHILELPSLTSQNFCLQISDFSVTILTSWQYKRGEVCRNGLHILW